MSGAETQVDLQIESKLLSVSAGIVSARGGRAKNRCSEPSERNLEAVHKLVVHG